MRIKMLKLMLLAIFSSAIFFYGTHKTAVHANAGGPPPQRTGAPGELTCAISGCHTSNALNTGPGSVAIGGVPDNYTPGQDYTITVSVGTFTGRNRFGFQSTVLDDQGRLAGTITATDTTRTFLQSGATGGNLRRYINHQQNGTNQNSWSFRWTAPATAVGRITFYAAGNAANGNGDDSGDFIYTTSKATQPMTAPAAIAAVSAASFALNGALSSDSIAALFGTNMATGIVIGTSNPPATTLGGVTVKVKDATNTERDAPLFFVSPAQINFIVPTGTMNGTATISVVNGTTTVGQGTVMIDSLAPGLFSSAGNGQGVAAAEVLRLKNDGTLSYEPVARFNAGTNTFEAIPIAIGPTEQAALILYGTGFRANTGLNTVSATIGGDNTEIFFAGAQANFAGLDQANIRLSPSLAGRGVVNVVLTVGGKASNAVTITMQ